MVSERHQQQSLWSSEYCSERRLYRLATNLSKICSHQTKNPKIALTGITGRAKALIRLGFKFNETPGEQIPHADVVTRIISEDDNDTGGLCFVLINVYFVQFKLQAPVQLSELSWNRLDYIMMLTEQKPTTGGNALRQKRVQTIEGSPWYQQRNRLLLCWNLHSKQTKICGDD